MERTAWRDRSGFCGVEPLTSPVGIPRPADLRALSGIAGRVAGSHDLLAEFADRYAAFPAQLVTASAQPGQFVIEPAPDHGPVLDAYTPCGVLLPNLPSTPPTS
ncbi:hypothetical protein [Actinoplanes sp. NPDC049265]|uniref:hypothetical protein n=1 Tax=Actinoplanes sp. NPDC049265 TaxID=3363902 RepID=UPI003712642E